jgi:hypothetical protein
MFEGFVMDNYPKNGSKNDTLFPQTTPGVTIEVTREAAGLLRENLKMRAKISTLNHKM